MLWWLPYHSLECIVCRGPHGMSTFCRRSTRFRYLAGKTPWKRVSRSCSSGWVPPPEVRVLGLAACRNCMCKLVLRRYRSTTLMVGALKGGCRQCTAETKPKLTPGFGRKSLLDTFLRSVLSPPCAKNVAPRRWAAAFGKREIDCVPLPHDRTGRRAGRHATGKVGGCFLNRV